MTTTKDTKAHSIQALAVSWRILNRGQ